MFQGERVRLRALQIENTDEAVLHEKRHDKFGTRFHAGLTADVTRIFGDVIDPQDAAFSGGSAREAMVKREAKARRNRIRGAHGESALQELRPFIPEHDAEDVIVHNFFDAFGDAAKELFAVKDGGDFAADFVQERKRIGLLGIGSEQAGWNGVSVARER